MTVASSISIRTAQPEDAVELHAMIGELAAFERLGDQFVASPEDLSDALFGTTGGAQALVAQDGSGALVGYAIYFENFSTFLCRRGLYLEDIYVRPTSRQQGIGKGLLLRLAKIASERGCGRMEWSVLDWNKNAIEFYESLGGRILSEWRIVRVDREGIERLANQ